MNLSNRKPLAPEPPEDWIDPDLVKAFGVVKDEDRSPWGPLRKKAVVEVYPQPTGPVKTPLEQ
jgi:hypothetical protein